MNTQNRILLYYNITTNSWLCLYCMNDCCITRYYIDDLWRRLEIRNIGMCVNLYKDLVKKKKIYILTNFVHSNTTQFIYIGYRYEKNSETEHKTYIEYIPRR